LKKALEKLSKRPVFPLNLRLIFQKLKFWKILNTLILLLTLILTFTFASCGDGSLGVKNNDNDSGIYIPPETVAGLYTGEPSNETRIASVAANNVAAAVTYVNANAGTYTLVLDADVNSAPQALNAGARTLTIAGKGSEHTITLTETGLLFTVNSGATLTLDNNITLTLKGLSNSTPVYVNGGTLYMRNGSKVTGNNAYPGSGGGVFVRNGNFTMSGGNISGNTAMTGGGVCVDGGHVTMSGGTISGNTAKYGGGVYGYGTFTMSGGTISDNIATGGGGVYVATAGTFSMTGGIILGNTASNRGGGVYVATFNKTGGTIYGKNEGANSNTATADTQGHAVYVYSSPAKYRDTTAGPTVNLNSGTAANWGL
jgi:hypothetical protein